jgi:hypothetical protein
MRRSGVRRRLFGGLRDTAWTTTSTDRLADFVDLPSILLLRPFHSFPFSTFRYISSFIFREHTVIPSVGCPTPSAMATFFGSTFSPKLRKTRLSVMRTAAIPPNHHRNRRFFRKAIVRSNAAAAALYSYIQIKRRDHAAHGLIVLVTESFGISQIVRHPAQNGAGHAAGEAYATRVVKWLAAPCILGGKRGMK